MYTAPMPVLHYQMKRLAQYTKSLDFRVLGSITRLGGSLIRTGMWNGLRSGYRFFTGFRLGPMRRGRHDQAVPRAECPLDAVAVVAA